MRHTVYPGNVTRNCAHCGTEFLTHPSEVKRGRGVYCSPECYVEARTRPLADRFWEKVDRNGPVPPHRPELGQCWVWTGSTMPGKWPYGVLGVGSDCRPMRAHRVSWELHNGSFPAGNWVLHHCDNPQCVRPDHLFLGDAPKNSADMVAKGRSAPMRAPRVHQQGSKNQAAKLVEAQVVEMRTRYAMGGINYAQLAVEYGVSRTLIYLILSRRKWQHV